MEKGIKNCLLIIIGWSRGLVEKYACMNKGIGNWNWHWKTISKLSSIIGWCRVAIIASKIFSLDFYLKNEPVCGFPPQSVCTICVICGICGSVFYYHRSKLSSTYVRVCLHDLFMQEIIELIIGHIREFVTNLPLNWFFFFFASSRSSPIWASRFALCTWFLLIVMKPNWWADLLRHLKYSMPMVFGSYLGPAFVSIKDLKMKPNEQFLLDALQE